MLSTRQSKWSATQDIAGFDAAALRGQRFGGYIYTDAKLLRGTLSPSRGVPKGLGFKWPYIQSELVITGS
jgi:hypothetical protein